MDIQMPVLDGYEATKQLKEQDETKAIPVIALTALAMKEQERKYSEIFDAYLKKPMDEEELILCLMKFLPNANTEHKESVEGKTSTYAQQFAEHIKKEGKPSDAFIKIYETEILPLYEEVNDIMDMEDSKELATKIIDTGTKYNIETFIKFGTEFMIATEGFQLSEMEKLLAEFGTIMNVMNCEL